ncbi:MAG: CotH kinase family protein [Opitutaceae bacterium]|nr:CotH kinase family protein [Opitutaceae bacterium]
MVEKRHRPFLLFLAAICAALVGIAVPVRAEVLISEFLAGNTSSLRDADGALSDWIELHNSDTVDADLTGWYLTDNAANKTKWEFPGVSIPAGGYLVVFASNKNRRDPGGELHTNFALAIEGEYLGLIKPDGTTVAAEFSPAYPLQTADISYGFVTPPTVPAAPIFFRAPTPGAANGSSGAIALLETVRYSRPSGPFTEPFTLELSGAGPGQHIRYEAMPPSTAGAVVREPTPASPKLTGPLLVDRPLLIKAVVFSDDLSAQGPASAAHFFQLDLSGPAGLGAFSTRLPVLVIEQHGFGGLLKPDGERPAWLYGYAPRSPGELTFATSPDIVTPVITGVRGSSSANFAKKSYNLDLIDEGGKKAAQPLFGGASFDEWALVGPYLYDPSLIRNSYLYALSNSIGRWAPRTTPVEVFLNTDGTALDGFAYVGVYALTDKIKIAKNRVDIAELRADATEAPAITGGYLLKIDVPDANEYSWSTEHGLDIDTISSVLVASPKADKLNPAQRDYIRGYVQQMENALHADRERGWKTHTYLDYIDRPSWVDFHILNTFSANPDSFERSAYFQKDRGRKIVAGPVWDFDRALGSTADMRSGWDAWHGENAAQPWHFGWWGVIATDPEFMQDWVDRWQGLRRDQFADRSLTVLADTLAAAIGPEAAARDYRQWEDNISEFGTHAGEINHLKDWLVKRAHWIDDQFVRPPAVTSNAATVTLVPATDTEIIYTLDGSDPRALGGEIAPNAIVTSQRVVVAASSNVQARSYRADLKDTFPGSPWSSAVGGPSSSPLSPKSRLVNISSRAQVGSGENALIAGVVIADTAGKRYLARAIGPGLAAFGADGTVPDPQLSIFSSEGVEWFRNNGWMNGPNPTQLVQMTRSVGAFPLRDGSNDSALAVEVAAGAYTIQITTPTGQSGIGLAELYELDDNGRTVNLSTRAQVGSDDSVLIGGFVVQGAAHKRMLIRAVGPTLAAFGVSNALLDPVLTVYSGPSIVASNDRWSAGSSATAVVAASTSVGAFDLAANSEDAALFITLAPGAYTVEVRGKGDAEGVALLEIYEVP